MTTGGRNNSQLVADLVVEELVRLGVSTFVLAPGSRSTPLVAAVAANPAAEHVVHFDERGCGFFALGMARFSGGPAVVITTSGTAVANLFPAVVEASSYGVPLLLLTADRPAELRDTGANQTIDQVKVFGRYVRWYFELTSASGEMDLALVLTTIDQAVGRCRMDRGPVHLNLQFREPFEPDQSGAKMNLGPELATWRTSSAPFTTYDTPITVASARQIDAIVRVLRTARRGLMVAGRLRSEAAGNAVLRLAREAGWPVSADILSGLTIVDGESSGGVHRPDTLLASEEARSQLTPDAVLQVGGRPVSKRLLSFVADSDPEQWIVVDDGAGRLDPHHRTTNRIEADPAAVCEQVVSALDETSGSAPHANSRYARLWTDLSLAAERAIVSTTADHGLSEIAVARVVMPDLLPGGALVLGNSMPVRDADAFAPLPREGVRVFASRGASGIDGTIAAAAGSAYGASGPVTVVLGDLAMLHDLNSLALVKRSVTPVVVIVLNNDGGGIFSFLPIASHDDIFEPLFAAPHGLSFEAAASQFDLPYQRVESVGGFRAAYREAVERGTSAIIEIPGDRAHNLRLHREVGAAVRDAVRDQLASAATGIPEPTKGRR